MATETKANYHKKTWTGRLNTDTNGRSGVFNYAGHFNQYSVGLHISLVQEPDRPVTVIMDKTDAIAAIELLQAFVNQAS